MKLQACHAHLSDLPRSLSKSPFVSVCSEPPDAKQTVSAASAYAIQAVEGLGLESVIPALFCIGGPVGSTLDYFDRARDPATGRLTGEGCSKRSRRIHPFTLLVGLQNQVAATLSLFFGWRGPCCSSVASATAFVEILPSIEIALRSRPAVVVMSSAGGRQEDRTWYEHMSPGNSILEGAVALYFDSPGELGRIEPQSSNEAPSDLVAAPLALSPTTTAPALEPGLELLHLLASDRNGALIELGAPHERRSFGWRRS